MTDEENQRYVDELKEKIKNCYDPITKLVDEATKKNFIINVIYNEFGLQILISRKY